MDIRAGQPDSAAAPNDRRAELDQRLHLWLVDPDAISSAELADAEAALLAPDETRRWKRYIRPQDRHLYLVAHVLVRQVLSLYAPVEPADWTFVTNEYGRPEVDPALQQSSALGSALTLRFNLSHTPGLVALLVHDHPDAGVDVERIGRVEDPLAMAPTVFADQELTMLDDLAPSEVEASFYRLWTLKESFIKAKGIGLAISLKDFWFSIDDSLSIRLGCRPSVDPHPGAWEFALTQPTATHQIAVASAAARQSIDIFTTDAADLLR